jgi:hypothetical protein
MIGRVANKEKPSQVGEQEGKGQEG